MPERASEDDLAGLRERILDFIATCRQPVLKEPDAEPLPVSPEQLTLELKGNRLLLQAWDDRRSLVRRVLRMRSSSVKGMTLAVHRVGAAEGTLTIADTALRERDLDRDLVRQRFRERFRKFLAQRFHGWKIERLTTERDLHRTFSERYTRAVLRQGQNEWAAIGVPETEGEAVHLQILTDGLLWLDHLRQGAARRKSVVRGLRLFVPEGSWRITANRLAFLDPELGSYELYFFSAQGDAQLVDPKDYGNVQTELSAPRAAASVNAPVREMIKPLAQYPGVEEDITPEGALSLRLRGLEFARAAFDAATFLDQPLHADHMLTAFSTLDEIARIRAPDSAEPSHSFYTRAPERWLESLLKEHLPALSLDLADSAVYSQTFSVAGPARGIIDLLAITKTGRLVVIELKADEDPQLPLQALDYWIRAKWHLERGDFETRGYFRGVVLRRDPPLLWLVFPSIRLHASSAIVLKYLSRAVPVSLLGVNENWRKGIHVVYRG